MNTEEITITFTYDDHKVEVTSKYPEGQVLSGIAALVEAGENKVVSNLLYGFRDDPHVAARLEEMGVEFGEEDDDDY